LIDGGIVKVKPVAPQSNYVEHCSSGGAIAPGDEVNPGATNYKALTKHPCPSLATPLRSAEIVRDAIKASGGLGEPWYLDGVNAARVGNLLFVIDVDDLGWVVTAYVIDGGEADPVAVLAAENGNPVRALTSWLRAAAGPMPWQRVKPGVYRSGAYLVGQLDTGEWFAEGPGVDRCFDHKHDAQAACAAARSYTATLPASARRRQGAAV